MDPFKKNGDAVACICYKTSTGKQSHPIHWVKIGTYPGTESGFLQAIKQESELIDSPFAHRIIKTRDADSRKVWVVEQCLPWKCCQPSDP
jgi:hypothetical protein